MALKSDVVKEYLGRFPETPSRSLATKIFNENKTLFKDIEEARSTVRYQRGLTGSMHRKKVIDKEHVVEIGKFKLNPYQLPESYKESKEPVSLPKANNNILLLSDLHIPYHDITAITLALKYGQAQKVNTIFINGDLLDFHSLSRFEKDPRKRSVKQEFDAATEFLTQLRKAFPTQKIVWLKGNHDVRYEKWLFLKAPEIFDDTYFQLEERLQLNKFKIELIHDLTLVKVGKLFITHGHHVIKGVFSPVNPARGVFTKTKSSMIIGHCHQVSEHTESNLKEEIITTWSTGCLCELHADYDRFNTKQAHGFAHIIVDKNGDYTVKNYRIHNGKIL